MTKTKAKAKTRAAARKDFEIPIAKLAGIRGDLDDLIRSQRRPSSTSLTLPERQVSELQDILARLEEILSGIEQVACMTSGEAAAREIGDKSHAIQALAAGAA